MISGSLALTGRTIPSRVGKISASVILPGTLSGLTRPKGVGVMVGMGLGVPIASAETAAIAFG
jgi:hypothetical protein